MNRELHLKRTPQLSFEYDPTIEEGVRLTRLIDELAPDGNPDTLSSTRSRSAIRSHDRFLVTTHENPDGDALGSILAMKLALEQLGKDAVLYLSGIIPLPSEYDFMDLDGLSRELPDDAAERVVLALDCANERRLGPDSGLRRERAARGRHRPPPRQLPLRRRQPDRRRTPPRRGRSSTTSSRELGVDAHAGDRRGALHRARHRHRALPVHEHDAEGAAASPRSSSRRAPTSTRSSRTSTRTSPSPSSSCSPGRSRGRASTRAGA